MPLSKQKRLLMTFRSMIIQESDSLEEAKSLASDIAYELKIGAQTRWPPRGYVGNPDKALLPGKAVSFHRQQQFRVLGACTRARNLGLPATLTLEQWLAVLDHFGRKCAYCRTYPYECLEHFESLTVNSKAGTTLSNCVPACRKCNVRKERSGLPPSALEDVYSYLQIANELFGNMKTGT